MPRIKVTRHAAQAGEAIHTHTHSHTHRESMGIIIVILVVVSASVSGADGTRCLQMDSMQHDARQQSVQCGLGSLAAVLAGTARAE